MTLHAIALIFAIIAMAIAINIEESK